MTEMPLPSSTPRSGRASPPGQKTHERTSAPLLLFTERYHMHRFRRDSLLQNSLQAKKMLCCCDTFLDQHYLEDRSLANFAEHFAADRMAESPVPAKQAQEKEATSSKNFTGEEIAPISVLPPALKPICDLSDRRYDGCEMWGDARTASGVNKSLVYFIPPPSQLATAEAATWSIRSQSRKIVGVREVVVRSLNLSSLHEAPNCTVCRSVPAVAFAPGGLTFNYWHAFSDVLVPLFTTARAFGGEVELVATGAQAWFLSKYGRVLGALTRYEVVDLDADGQVRCYPHLIVGLRGHRDFDIDPARAPNNYDMLAFRMFVRRAYSLPPPTAALPCRSGGDKPRLMIILRGATRRFVNADAIVDAIERAGFEVMRMEPTSAAGMDAVARGVDACDVLVASWGRTAPG